mgnify:FL=1
MRKTLLGIDLAICSLWTIAALGSRMAWVGTPATWIVMLLIMSRLLLSFTLYRKEKKSWIPGLLFVGLTAFAVSVGLDIKLSGLASKVFPLLSLDFDRWWYVGLTLAVATWLWIVPLVVFLVNIFRKGCLTDTLTWKDALGKLLWTDKTARTYCSLLLITIGTLYAGLAMNARLCLFASVVAPTLSFHLLKRYYGLKKGKVWVLVISMLIFFFAQTHAGLLRMTMLGISFCMVIYVCSFFYQDKKKLLLSVISAIYIGILLPCLAIGNNQYTCFNVGRTGYYSLDAYPGIFCIEDKETGKIGLRSRYGLLVKPEYESIVYHTPRHWFGKLELRKNGYYTLYDICNNEYRKDNHISHQLQDSICQIVEEHLSEYDYKYDERLEVKLIEANNSQVRTHIRALKNGFVIYYHYDDKEPFIPTDSISYTPGTIVCDSLVGLKWCQLQSLSYAHDATTNDSAVYNIQVTLARENMPKPKEAEMLVQKISCFLKKVDIISDRV